MLVAGDVGFEKVNGWLNGSHQPVTVVGDPFVEASSMCACCRSLLVVVVPNTPGRRLRL